MSSVATPSMIRTATLARRVADMGVWDGASSPGYLASCRHLHESGAQIIFTRDVGHHTSGWWKNPDYEACLHLSLSFWDLEQGITRPFEDEEAETWVRLFFGPHVNLIWQESAVSPDGIAAGLQHYRVFCDATWRPIKPRGEVYSTQFTELGWKSWSEVQAEKRRAVTA